MAILRAILRFFADNGRTTFEKVIRPGLSGAEQLRAVLAAHFDQFARSPPSTWSWSSWGRCD